MFMELKGNFDTGFDMSKFNQVKRLPVRGRKKVRIADAKRSDETTEQGRSSSQLLLRENVDQDAIEPSVEETADEKKLKQSLLTLHELLAAAQNKEHSQ